MNFSNKEATAELFGEYKNLADDMLIKNKITLKPLDTVVLKKEV